MTEDHKLKDKILKVIDNVGTKVALAIGGFRVREEKRMTKNPLLEWPRNYNCVCGSGKKFKKCCLPQLSSVITIEDAMKINERLDHYRVR